MPAAPDRDELRRLHFVNALFAHLTGHDLYLAEQIRSAIAFSLGELETQMREHPEYAARYGAAFTAAAAKLVAKFFTGKNDHGFFHWDAASTLVSPTPLFARAELMAGLKRLAPFRESTLLVTNLRRGVARRSRARAAGPARHAPARTRVHRGARLHPRPCRRAHAELC